MIVLIAPVIITVVYLCATEFPQQSNGVPGGHLRARGDETTDCLAWLMAVLPGLVILGVAARKRPLPLFLVLAFIYLAAATFAVSQITWWWQCHFVSFEQRL